MSDGIVTFGNKTIKANYCGMLPINFLCDDIETRAFYKYLAAPKSDKEVQEDISVTNKFLNERGFVLLSGEYSIKSADSGKRLIIYDSAFMLSDEESRDLIVLSNSTIDGKYEIVSPDSIWILVFDEKNMNASFRSYRSKVAWGNHVLSNNQLFDIKKEEEHYYILWMDYALTREDEGICWTQFNRNENQRWTIQSLKVE